MNRFQIDQSLLARAATTVKHVLRATVGVMACGIALTALGAGRVTTTIYPGQHFELRDHDEPVKYIFNGSTRVARITSSLRASTMRIQRLRLHKNWNLVSTAVSITNAMYQFTNNLPTSVPGGRILRWNASASGWVPLAAGQAIPSGAVLWIYADADCTVSIVGTYVEPADREVDGRGQFLPSAGLEAWKLTAAMLNVPVATAWLYDAAIPRWLWLAPFLPPQADLPVVVAPGSAVFVRAENSAQLPVPPRALAIRYYHQDHLGSSSVITGADGERLDETALYPFGAPRFELQQSLAHDSYQFTQKERDRESSLSYFGKRFYSARLGKWLSTDPKAEAGGGLNLYAYVNNNPLKYRDPDGAEISVTQLPVDKEGITTYRIELKAAVMDVAEAHPKQKLDRAQLDAYAKDLTSTINKRYSHYDPKTKTRWETVATIRVLNASEKPAADEHVFMIVGGYKMTGAGQTRFRPKGEHEKERGMIMKIQVHTLLDARPDKQHPDKNYKSPESIGAHEFGHAAGLDDLETDKKNLMSHGRENDSQVITFQQMRTIVKESQQDNLNKRLE